MGKTAFKKLEGVKLPKKKQMLIRAICLNYNERPKHEQEKIRRLCDKCGGAYSAALFRVMTSEDSITKISLEHHVSQSRLYDFRREFYEGWDKRK